MRNRNDYYKRFFKHLLELQQKRNNIELAKYTTITAMNLQLELTHFPYLLVACGMWQVLSSPLVGSSAEC